MRAPAGPGTGIAAPVGPPEDRGAARDGVTLLVARPGGLHATPFRDLATALRPGDLVVVNTSATLPAALDAVRPGGRPVAVHLSTPLPSGEWVVELRDGGRVRDEPPASGWNCRRGSG